MAVDMKRITRGKIKRAPRVVTYGFDGVGKTSFASGAPEPFFLDANRGRYKFDVAGVDIESWDDYKGWLDAIEAGKVPCKTVVSDALTDLEAMCAAKLFPGVTVSEVGGGYKKGEDALVLEWRTVLAQFERLWIAGKTIVLLGHATVRSFTDPTGPNFQRFEIACRPEVSGMFRQWADYVLFAREDVVAAKRKATSAGSRWIYTRRDPAFDAKARGTNAFPEKIPLSWAEFAGAVEEDEVRGASMLKEIDEMLSELADSELEKVVRTFLKDYPAHIPDAHNRVRARLEEHQKRKEAVST